MEATRRDDRIRLAELMAALSLATDLGTGQPLEHQLGVCLSTLELADRLGCSAEERSEVYFVALLAHVGCSAAAPYLADWAGGDEIHFQSDAPVLGPAADAPEVMRHMVRRLANDRPMPERARHVARALAAGQRPLALMGANLCEGAPLLAQRLQLPETVARALGQLMERWDGNGAPGAAAGEQIARSVRIVRVAVDLVGISHVRDPKSAIDALERRRGRGFDPQVVGAALADPQALLRAAKPADAWEQVLDAEPPPVTTISTAGMTAVARAVGEFVDLKVGFLYGHSTRVAEIAAAAAAALVCSDAEVADVRAAGFLHDLGRVAVPNGIWAKPASTPATWCASTLDRQRSTRCFAMPRAASTDPALRELWETSEEQRLKGATIVIDDVLRKGPLKPGIHRRQAIDILWLLMAPEQLGRLRRRGWADADYESWLADTLVAQLLP